MRPTVGRIVHYVNLGDKDGKYPPQVQAAVITAIYKRVPDPSAGMNDVPYKLVRVDDGVGEPGDDIVDNVDLKVFYKTGLFDCEKMPKRTNSNERGVWDWPPKV